MIVPWILNTFVRCKDRTESGSFLGAFLCTESKCGGPMVNVQSQWMINLCYS